MKPIGKRGKLLLLVGIPIMLVLAASLYLAFHQDALQADFEKIKVGMTRSEFDEILEERRFRDFGVNKAEYRGFLRQGMTGDLTPGRFYHEPDSVLAPGRSIWVRFDQGTGRLTEKSIYRPDMREIWNHWKRQLGL